MTHACKLGQSAFRLEFRSWKMEDVSAEIFCSKNGILSFRRQFCMVANRKPFIGNECRKSTVKYQLHGKAALVANHRQEKVYHKMRSSSLSDSRQETRSGIVSHSFLVAVVSLCAIVVVFGRQWCIPLKSFQNARGYKPSHCICVVYKIRFFFVLFLSFVFVIFICVLRLLCVHSALCVAFYRRPARR